jgi:hypothetical protein
VLLPAYLDSVSSLVTIKASEDILVVVHFSSKLSFDVIISALGVHNTRINLELMIIIMDFKMHQLCTGLEVSVTVTTISEAQLQALATQVAS